MDCNLIIHGVKETMIKTKEEIDHDDKDYVECRMKDMEIKVNILKIERLGQFTREKEVKQQYRPLKINLENEEMKMQVLQNLTKLKGLNIKITEDLTREERRTMEKWRKYADQKNEEEGNETFKWRVRGSPRSRVYLKKVYTRHL